MRLLRPDFYLLLVLITAISACQTVPKTGHTTPVDGTATVPDASATELTPTEEEIIRAFELETAKSWLEAAQLYQSLAENSIQPERSSFYIRAALMFYYDERYLYIEPFFSSLAETDILERDKLYKEVILAGSFLGNGRIYQSLLALPEIDNIIDYRFKVLALNIRSRGVLAIGKPMESAVLRMQIDRYLKTEAEIAENHAFIWDALNRISEPTILNALSEQQTVELRGWLELNLIARRSNMLPTKIEPWITQWYQLYGDHPAGSSFAINLLEESKRVFIKPAKIALMLPFSGRMGNVSGAIQNGFLYAHYLNNDDATPALEIIDASADPDKFNLQYQQAIQNGAEFIVGPISKELINLLQQQEQLEVPTLTLNYGDEVEPPLLNLYQFGLRPEDEAEQIADYALADDKHHAITLVPDTEWGSRLQVAFSERYEALGGSVVGSEVYPAKKNDYSAAIKKLLNLTSSNQRHKIIQQVIGEPLKFDSRRRQDIDMVFIAANARQARLIKPQLKFHHAQGVPVYATSHISSSNRNVDNDRDLDKIQFVDIPWMLNQHDNRDYQQIIELWPSSGSRFSRLFALGIDAYRLIPSLRRLMIHPEENAAHHTGELTVDKNGRVHRRLLMATYEKGLARVLVVDDNTSDTSSSQ
ncbi:MAG: penicillin-binding protein activator [Gammaproteobacteria bacterium]|nr:penicillin-binding protein activator [Gammaproteobacteria bacterium]